MQREISRARRIADAVFFPLRALGGPVSILGLSSLREQRMREVYKFTYGRVLDVGCGPHNLFIENFIGREMGVGIDFYPYEGVTTVIEDSLNLPFADASFDVVTLIAVGGHIPKSVRAQEFAELARLIKPGGRLVMTEGEPVTQYLVHKWAIVRDRLFGVRDIDTERGMEEDEEYCMPQAELLESLNTPPFKLRHRKRFMWGLNNVYVSEKVSGLPAGVSQA